MNNFFSKDQWHLANLPSTLKPFLIFGSRMVFLLPVSITQSFLIARNLLLLVNRLAFPKVTEMTLAASIPEKSAGVLCVVRIFVSHHTQTLLSKSVFCIPELVIIVEKKNKGSGSFHLIIGVLDSLHGLRG